MSAFKEWIELMRKMASYEQVTYRLRGREDLFNGAWGLSLSQLEKH